MVFIYDSAPGFGIPKFGLIEAEFLRLRDQARSLESLGSYASTMLTLTGVFFGLVPGFQTLKLDAHTALKQGGRTEASAKGGIRLRNSLVVAEVALSLILLSGAGLLVKSFWRLQQVNLGFKTERLLTMRLFPPAAAYPDDQRLTGFYERLRERVRPLPGVIDVAAASAMPVGAGSTTALQIQGQPVEASQANMVQWRLVSPDYFRTLGVRLVRGRFLDDSDREQAMAVAVVNETLARAHWPNEDPLGRRIRLLDTAPERTKAVFLTVVGVVADVKNSGLTEPARQEVYVPMSQRTAAVANMGGGRQMTLAIRTSPESGDLVNTIRRAVWALDHNIPITDVRTMEQILETVTGKPRFSMILLAALAGLALALAMIGLYGVLAFNVSQRRREIGVRIALGAQSWHVLGLITRMGISLTLMGIGLGLGGSFVLSRVLQTLLFEVNPTDPLTFTTSILMLAVVALLASWLPARRATNVDPMEALRYE